MKTESTTMQLHKRAYDEGYDVGVMLEYPSNPYHESTQAHSYWNEGYQAGQDNAPPCEDE